MAASPCNILTEDQIKEMAAMIQTMEPMHTDDARHDGRRYLNRVVCHDPAPPRAVEMAQVAHVSHLALMPWLEAKSTDLALRSAVRN